MVTVTVGRGGDTKRLALAGHADFCPGHDIVCAACSALVFALLEWADKSPQHLHAVREIKCQKGDAVIAAAGDASFEAAYDMAVLGLEKIAKKYPKHVRIKRT